MSEVQPHTDAATFDGQHICFITNLYPPETIGGAETSVRTVAEALVERDYEVSVITTATSDDARAGDGSFCERQNGVSVHRFTPWNLYTPFEYREQPGWKKPLMHLVDLWNPQASRTVNRLLGDSRPISSTSTTSVGSHQPCSAQRPLTLPLSRHSTTTVCSTSILGCSWVAHSENSTY
jgi:hypothetical protein